MSCHLSYDVCNRSDSVSLFEAQFSFSRAFLFCARLKVKSDEDDEDEEEEEEDARRALDDHAVIFL